MSTSMHELDKISQLPDDILIKIVSTLDLKNAAQTSIIAKRWRYLWTWLEDLDFDPDTLFPDMVSCDEIEYMNLVNRVLNAHRSLRLSKFRFFFYYTWTSDTSHVENWVRFAFSKRVEHLDLDFLTHSGTYRMDLGFDILKHFTLNLKSLRLIHADVSGEILEFILSQCHLENLYLRDSITLHCFNIASNNLKHLTLLECVNLRRLEIDASNLVSFSFNDSGPGNRRIRTHVAFKNVPKLAEVTLRGVGCLYPFRILDQISCLSQQLTKFSFSPEPGKFVDRGHIKVGVLFCYVTRLSLTVRSFSSTFIEPFMNACPMLHELKLQLFFDTVDLREEAKQLQEIELENEIKEEMSVDQSLYAEALKKDAVGLGYVENKNDESHPNIKVLEVWGFHGCNSDIKFVLNIIARGVSLETLLWDCVDDMETDWDYEDHERTHSIKRRAHKLAKLLPPEVHLGVRDNSGIFWVS